MAILRTLSGTPRYVGAINLTLPAVNANATAELAVPATTFNVGMQGGGVSTDMLILAHPVDPITGAVAFPASLVMSHAYVKAADGKIYFRLANVTGVNYTSADVVTFHVIGF